MSVIAVTLFVSLCLAGMFVVFFYVDSRGRGRRGGFEREALLPFDDAPPPRQEPHGEQDRQSSDTGPSSSPGARAGSSLGSESSSNPGGEAGTDSLDSTQPRSRPRT